MNDQDWVLIDTETTGLAAPIFVVELGAQRMRGWQPVGPSFRRLLNQNLDIPPEASRVHGYTREILERDGDPAAAVYRDFDAYAGGLPIVAYNLEYDLDEVLLPEWRRLRIQPIGTRGFCALRLAQRLLDPVPAGNCKLQTLRQYYRLPERGAHTALGDVETVADLLASVLRPIALNRHLDTWADICAYAHVEWFPSRIAFGKFKGRRFLDARTDRALLDWLTWLASSKRGRSAQMGRWYLLQLELPERGDGAPEPVTASTSEGAQAPTGSASSETGMVVFVDPSIAQLRQLVEAARARLAELDARYTQDRHAVDLTQARVFRLMRAHYQERDRLRLIVDYRSKYLATLLRDGEDDADQVASDYSRARTQADANYTELDADASKRKQLSDDEENELKVLFKKLVRLYHPDRFANQPDKISTYEQLTSAINQAREHGDIARLREIANDPHGFILRKGWASLDFNDATEVKALGRLLDTLRIEIVTVMDSLNDLHDSPEFELYQLSAHKPSLLDEVASRQALAIDAEIAELESRAAELNAEIAELAGNSDARIA